MRGALLIDKHEGVSSFGVIEELQRSLMRALGVKKRDLPKMGHGGTLDPFATGLLVVCVGQGVKLSRYFLDSPKKYEGTFRFGETTVPGDPTAPITEKTDTVPDSIEILRDLAHRMTLEPYIQTPPMHSAKKVDGRPLYELARQGIEIERKAKSCHLYQFEILNYDKPRAHARVLCSSGTYIRTLAQDFAKMQASLALLETLRRTAAGNFEIKNAWTVSQVIQATEKGKRWDELPCWVPFDELLTGMDRAQATDAEVTALIHGKQEVLVEILKTLTLANKPYAKQTPDESVDQSEHCVSIYEGSRLVAIARRTGGVWGLDRVFTVPTLEAKPLPH